MKRPVGTSMTLCEQRFFPYVRRTPSGKRYRAVIGVGGNVGDVPRRLKRLFLYLRRHPAVDLVATAPLLVNPPFGYTDQADFVNTVIEISTDLAPLVLLRFLMHAEKIFGRRRSFKNAPRTLDLDIIFFESKVMYNDRLILPHPHWRERPSVVVPLALLGRHA